LSRTKPLQLKLIQTLLAEMTSTASQVISEAAARQPARGSYVRRKQKGNKKI
jgi:hypothetical protein